jgi:hypothetical protein
LLKDATPVPVKIKQWLELTILRIVSSTPYLLDARHS